MSTRKRRQLLLFAICAVTAIGIFASSNRSSVNIVYFMISASKQVDISPWTRYRNNWNEEILIRSDEDKKKILFPKVYAKAMTDKGPHPLTRDYPKFQERLNYIDTHCPNLDNPIDYKLNLGKTSYFLHFNDDYEVINCLVPKAASDIWTRQFAKMQGPHVYTSLQFVYNISITNHLGNPVETARRMQTYTKFFVRRHPFERLVSAYINKFEHPVAYAYMEAYAKVIITSNLLKELLFLGKNEILKQIDRLYSPNKFNITFTEFVNFVTSSLDDKAIDALDIHWKPVSRICNPCAVRYDVIIEHDNVVEESQMLVDYLQANKPTNPPLHFEPYPRTSTRDKCNKYFTKLSKGLRQKLYELYRDDFLLFGYECNPESEYSACDGV